MLIEATGQPLRYRLKTGEEVVLSPGHPVEVPDAAGLRLLEKAVGRVRLVTPPADADPCPVCQKWFWCPTCTPRGIRACACDHLVLAAKVARQCR